MQAAAAVGAVVLGLLPGPGLVLAPRHESSQARNPRGIPDSDIPVAARPTVTRTIMFDRHYAVLFAWAPEPST